jgi:hypothetical protein
VKPSKAFALVKSRMYHPSRWNRFKIWLGWEIPHDDLFICFALRSMYEQGIIDGLTLDETKNLIYATLRPRSLLVIYWYRDIKDEAGLVDFFTSDHVRSPEYIHFRDMWLDILISQLQEQGK